MQIKFPVEDELSCEEDRKLSWLSLLKEHVWSIVLIIGCSIALGLFLANRGAYRATREQDFFNMTSLLRQLEQGEEVDQAQVSKLMQKYPEVTAAFDHMLRDEKLLEGEQEAAGRLEKEIVTRLSYLPTHYLTYMEAIRALEDERFDDAKQQLNHLRKVIKEEGIQEFPRLYCFVLARCAFLEGQSGEEEKKQSAKQELKELLYDEKSSLGEKAQQDLQAYVKSDEFFFSQFFE